jgi:hypothetical protein
MVPGAGSVRICPSGSLEHAETVALSQQDGRYGLGPQSTVEGHQRQLPDRRERGEKGIRPVLGGRLPMAGEGPKARFDLRRFVGERNSRVRAAQACGCVMTSSLITVAVVRRRRRPSCVNRQNVIVTSGGSSANHAAVVVWCTWPS